MKKMVLFTLIFALFNFTAKSQIKTIYVRPLGNVDPSHIECVKHSLESFYKVKCVVLPQDPLTKDLLSISGTRYDANKILNRFNSKNNTIIITEKDITTEHRGYKEWGVLGLGYRPGTTCVVSTFRMKKNVTEQKLHDRLIKVSIHEVGHNLGLDHCKHDIHCMMNDARGTISQIDKEKIWFCKNCKEKIGMNP